MDTDIIEILRALYGQKISVDEFLHAIFKDTQSSDSFLANLFAEAISKKDELKIALAVTLLCTDAFNYNAFVEVLSQLLLLPWHHNHEDIAGILKHLKNPSSIEYLYSAATMQFEYLEYDDTYQFARKCIKALAAIKDQNALDKLRLLTKSDNEIIAAYARKELVR